MRLHSLSRSFTTTGKRIPPGKRGQKAPKGRDSSDRITQKRSAGTEKDGIRSERLSFPTAFFPSSSGTAARPAARKAGSSRWPQRLGGTGPRLSLLPPPPAQPRLRSAARALARARHLRGPAAARPAPAPPARSRPGRLSLRAGLAGGMRGEERRKGGAARGAGLTQHQVPGSRRALATCPAAPRGRRAEGEARAARGPPSGRSPRYAALRVRGGRPAAGSRFTPAPPRRGAREGGGGWERGPGGRVPVPARRCAGRGSTPASPCPPRAAPAPRPFPSRSEMAGDGEGWGWSCRGSRAPSEPSDGRERSMRSALLGPSPRRAASAARGRGVVEAVWRGKGGASLRSPREGPPAWRAARGLAAALQKRGAGGGRLRCLRPPSP